MSNKVVPQVYRAIIDDVIQNVSVDFEEYGMDDELLPLLQSLWEKKLLETRVAEFARDPAAEDAGGADAAAVSSSSAPSGPNESAVPPPAPQSTEVSVKNEPEDPLRLRGGSSYEPASERPQPNAAGLLPGDEVIDSDLDDSDDLGDDGDDGEDGEEIDIVFCVYDKVQRVKNKWKAVFKDGLIHINGKDYLFTKCQGEFEW